MWDSTAAWGATASVLRVSVVRPHVLGIAPAACGSNGPPSQGAEAPSGWWRKQLHAYNEPEICMV